MKLEEIESDILRKYSRYLISLDPILNQTGFVRTLHTGGFRYEENGNETTTSLNKISLAIEISQITIVNYDLEVFTQDLFEFVKQQLTEMHKTMYRSLEVLTKLTGNIVNANGRLFSADMILDMLEKIQIRFDDKDKPILPQLIIHPAQYQKLSGIKFTPEQEERHKKIIETKRREFNAKKRYRRLSYIN